MSKNLHNIDDLFKRAIDDHLDTPSDKVWDAIDKNLDKKKVVSISKKYNKLKWVAAILLLFSTGMAMYVWQTGKRNKELVKENNINKASKTRKENINNDENISTPKIKTGTEKNDSLTGNHPATGANEQTIAGSANEPDINSSLKRMQVKTKEKGKLNLVVTQNDQEHNEPQKEVRELRSDNKNSSPSANYKINEDGKSVGKAERSIDQVPRIFNNNRQWYNSNQIQFSNPFSYKPGIAPAENIVAAENDNKISPAKNRSGRSAKTSPFSATVFFSPEFVSTNVKDDHPRFREDDRHEIKNSENERASSNYGILLTYNIGNNWSIQSGASVFTRATDITPKMIYARPDDRGNVNYRLSCSAGSAYVPVKSGAAPAQGDSTKILSAKNTLQYVTVPFSVAYSLGKGKLKLVPSAGISANILSKGTVETVIVTSTGNESSSTNIEGLKSTYFTSQIGIGAEYRLSRNIGINFTPTTRLALSSINKNAAVKTKLNSVGLSAGVTIRL
jgi:hypothetical protein